MQQIVCPTQLIHPAAKVPERSNSCAAGHDIFCVAGLEGLPAKHPFTPEEFEALVKMEQQGFIVIEPEAGFLFRTGFAQAIQPGYVCLLHDRSGMGAVKQVGRLAGVIDEDYRGEWFVRLINHSRRPVTIKVGDKIVQGIYQERVEAEFPVVTSLPESERGQAGFGSSDSKTGS